MHTMKQPKLVNITNDNERRVCSGHPPYPPPRPNVKDSVAPAMRTATALDLYSNI